MHRCLRDFIFGIIFGHHPAYNVRYIALKRGCAADRLVLSDGHACPIIYAAAADLGIAIGRDPDSGWPMTRKDALRLRALESEIDGHPNPAKSFPSLAHTPGGQCPSTAGRFSSPGCSRSLSVA